MIPAVSALLTATGVAIVLLGAWAAYWVLLDAREAAAQRRREAEIADVLQRRVTQARDARYLTYETGRPE